ncbi:hypothetical protein BBO99_00002193 [Phytophthora kernoviae]|uniref:Myb/SANT-like domain-containing protein n=2 Tax=Phytophthora kernoviae TaxID=325452 RepID=A0A3R7K395_9STRA|nr:hypothetical protein G195_002485 [Phytophthora kernoviae 00238/432]KAG2529846.1 hypothetical protein JM16_001800 [Phytophthora kernoviae]KAG2531191.1 hypothetical protein JM18_001787 [Phytophthora kernoviae]RLN10598.1 hypothetical protein BBI17_001887 [Phytophthora kernoviae]RLN83365.1 hypothetical protein BBO99_00002193 [Phytophthora kernoviae]
MSGKRERAVWGLTEEQVLLELFRQARNDPQVRSDRGVKARGWASIMAEINRRCSRAFDKDQLKSKYARLMQEYELFKSVGGHRGRLDDSDWEQAMREKPRNVTLLKQFKAHGFAHTDICSRIVGDKEDSEDIPSLPLVPEPSAEIVGLKRSPSVQDSELEIKRARMEARHDPDVRSDKGIRGRGWVEVIAELNKQCNTSLDKEQIKSKFARLMQEFDTFKEATGFSGDPDTAPQSANDWDQLIDERPEFLNQLVQFKEKNGFPHIELCSLITVSLAANALPFLLPARAATLAAQLQPPARHAQSEAAETPVGVDPNFFTPELRNNLNTFLKTATAYLVMLINDHNQEGDF